MTSRPAAMSAGIACAAGAGIYAVVHWWADLFGPGTWGTGGNMVAWVICGALGTVATYLLRDRLGPALSRWWRRHHSDPHAAAAREEAAAARRIMADLYRHHTGKDHPDAPHPRS